jgi:FOG: WD40 repeat
MSHLSVDASNSCIPPNCNLVGQIPPLPKPERGVPLILDGNSGRRNAGAGPILLYPSRQFVIARNLETGKSFVYRGHTANVTVAKFSPSGAYVASADVRGKLRVWSWDQQEHLCKLDIVALSGPIRDLSWDLDSQRIVVVGEGSPSDPSSLCARVLQWDTGVKLGDLGQHARKKPAVAPSGPVGP